MRGMKLVITAHNVVLWRVLGHHRMLSLLGSAERNFNEKDLEDDSANSSQGAREMKRRRPSQHNAFN